MRVVFKKKKKEGVPVSAQSTIYERSASSGPSATEKQACLRLVLYENVSATDVCLTPITCWRRSSRSFLSCARSFRLVSHPFVAASSSPPSFWRRRCVFVCTTAVYFSKDQQRTIICACPVHQNSFKLISDKILTYTQITCMYINASKNINDKCITRSSR